MSNKLLYSLLVITGQLLWSGCSPKTSVNQAEAEVSFQEQPLAPARLWKDTDTSFARNTCPGKVFPLEYRLLDVDSAGARKLLIVHGKQPGIIAADTILLDIPLPDGTWEQFRISQVQVMAPELAAKYPYLKTYAGSSMVYPADQIRLEASPEGVRGMILSTRGTILLDPFCKDDKLHMISFFKKNLPEGLKEEFEER